MARKNARGPMRHTFEPDYAVPPGLTLQETIDALGIDQRELAIRAELSAKHVNQIIKGIAPITQETAIRLERVTGVPARVWNNLESHYREQIARLAEKDRLKHDLNWLRTIPTAELIKRGKIPATKDRMTLLQHVLSFFGVASVEAWRVGWANSQFAFRKSLKLEGQVGAIATWLRLGELEAIDVQCESFDRTKFLSAVSRIRALTVEAPEQFVPKMSSLSADSGVALVIVPEIKGVPVNGAAKWLTPTKAMICLNLRGKHNDKFWFTFFHEAGHILNDSKKVTFVDVDYKDDPREHQANRFAATTLIPPEHEDALKLLYSHHSVRLFAMKIGIAPGIVVGRLQNDKIIPFDWLNKLKVSFDWAPP